MRNGYLAIGPLTLNMLKIAIAKTPDQIDDILKLRYQVQSQNSLPTATTNAGRLVDRFDAFSSTTHLVAIESMQVAGSLRLTLNTKAGTPVGDRYKWQTSSIEKQALLSCDMHCLLPSLNASQTTLGLFLMACYVAIGSGVTYIIASVHPDSVAILEQIGFTVVAHKDAHRYSANTLSKNDQVPLILDVQQDLKDSFVQFSERNDLQELMHSYGCALYQPGEAILRAGTAGNCAFVIADGEVDVKHPGSDKVVDTMGAGEVFGELALLTDQVRSADIVAKTEVRAMILEKSIFVEYLMSEPTVALKLLTSMGQRMKHLIDYVKEQTV